MAPALPQKRPALRLRLLSGVALSLVALLGLTSCDKDPVVAGDTPPSPATIVTPDGRPSAVPEVVTGDVTVQNDALGDSEELVERAIADLKRLGFWGDLTDHLYVLKISSRPGPDRIPDDGHLADAFLTAQIDETTAGSLCDVMFFPDAMVADLARYEDYYNRGLLPDPTPTLRQFWASILGHELAHCLDHGRGEPTAERWEKKVLAAARERV
jgi:hypothetical protein